MAEDHSDIRGAVEQTRAELSDRLDALSGEAARLRSDLQGLAAETLREGTKKVRATRKETGRKARKARRRAQKVRSDTPSLGEVTARTSKRARRSASKAKSRAADTGRAAADKVSGGHKHRSGARRVIRVLATFGAVVAGVAAGRRVRS